MDHRSNLVDLQSGQCPHLLRSRAPLDHYWCRSNHSNLNSVANLHARVPDGPFQIRTPMILLSLQFFIEETNPKVLNLLFLAVWILFILGNPAINQAERLDHPLV